MPYAFTLKYTFVTNNTNYKWVLWGGKLLSEGGSLGQSSLTLALTYGSYHKYELAFLHHRGLSHVQRNSVQPTSEDVKAALGHR